MKDEEIRQQINELIKDEIQELINNNKDTVFTDCFNVSEGKMGVVVTFLAILELVKENIIDLIQNDSLSVIYLKAKE